MRRKKREDQAEEFRERIVQRDAEPLREGPAAWIGSIAESLAIAEPEMPPGVTTRAREIWEPLLAIADAAGSHWPNTARQACAHFVREASYQPLSTGARLLADLRTLFAQRTTDRLSTADIFAELCSIDEAPWGEINGGRALDARRQSKELAAYQVRPAAFKSGSTTVKGYVTYATPGQVGLNDAWARYLSDVDQVGGTDEHEG